MKLAPRIVPKDAEVRINAKLNPHFPTIFGELEKERVSSMPSADPGDFKGEHMYGEIYTAENLRPIDVIMELFTMLKADKMYGQPGTDGTFWSNVMEMIKNDNDFISIFMLNKAHPFNKQKRMAFFMFCIFLNVLINSYMGIVKGINQNVLSLIVSCLLIVVKKGFRLAYEAPCMSHDAAASKLRDEGKDPDVVVLLNETRQKPFKCIVNTIIGLLCLSTVTMSIVSAYSNFEIAQYILTLAFNVVVFAFINVFFNVLIGTYGKNREEFEIRWGSLVYDGKYLHPKNIGEVAEAIVKFHGGRENALKHLDAGSRDNYYDYFCIDGAGVRDIFSPESIERFRSMCACLNINERMVVKYEARFDGQEHLNPYDPESKEALYGKAVETNAILRMATTP